MKLFIYYTLTVFGSQSILYLCIIYYASRDKYFFWTGLFQPVKNECFNTGSQPQPTCVLCWSKRVFTAGVFVVLLTSTLSWSTTNRKYIWNQRQQLHNTKLKVSFSKQYPGQGTWNTKLHCRAEWAVVVEWCIVNINEYYFHNWYINLLGTNIQYITSHSIQLQIKSNDQ